MIVISSEAGKRLAQAKAACDRWYACGARGETTGAALRLEYAEAAGKVADELIAQGFHQGGEGEVQP
ncbi:hypothetical protein [Chromohalobacter moromii]|uniref:Uncharacterized protein n=1 Tax=Chromohalobacter moromii TaxID=2860329 RepID=A0A9X2X3Q4_9GAMM|nr:hypothetical protein [Chromohalobacter moromii]MCT8506161.1 hypothetical protein [Chromohalobacter moromii]